jgi:UrcA family protein
MKIIALNTMLLIFSLSILSVAKAGPPPDPPTAVAKISDLDISRPAGKQDLYRRLLRAARAACSPGGWPDKAPVAPEYEACVDQAMSDAVARFNRAEFSDYVAAQASKSTGNGLHLAGRY